MKVIIAIMKYVAIILNLVQNLYIIGLLFYSTQLKKVHLKQIFKTNSQNKINIHKLIFKEIKTYSKNPQHLYKFQNEYQHVIIITSLFCIITQTYNMTYPRTTQLYIRNKKGKT